MRASPTRVRGNAGEQQVIAAFSELGWGAVLGDAGEVGTDVLAMARSEDLLALGTLVGAQVKTGASFFRSPVREGRRIAGWWFDQADQRHVDYWLGHSVPHIIVIRRDGPGPSFWAHIARQSVESTGDGNKIFVPADQRLDESGRERLEAVARSGRRPASWDGTAWRKVADLPAADLLRYALLAPRLVAPHPWLGAGARLSAEAATALLVLARVSELDRFTARAGTPRRHRDASITDDWAWSFYGAVSAYLEDSDMDPLLSLARSASPNGSPAARVTAAGCLIEAGSPDRAVALLRGRQAGPLTAVDKAWSELQLARALVEIGSVERGRRLALRVYGVGAAVPDDVTALALSGVAAILLFNTADWPNQDTAQVATAADTAALWWIIQSEYSALAAGVDRVFNLGGLRGGADVRNEVPEINKLIGASFVASCMANQSDWATTTRLRGLQRFVLADSRVDQLEEALRELVAAGDDKKVNEATNRLVFNGPASVVRDVAAGIDLTKLTRTTAKASLVLLQRGGDVVDEATASASVRWILRTLDRPERFLKRTRPSYLAGLQLAETLAGIAGAADQRSTRAIAKHVLALPQDLDDLIQNAWARVIEALDDSAWTSTMRNTARSAARRRYAPLRAALLRVSAKSDPKARAELLADARKGSISAMAAAGDVRDLSNVTARRVIEQLATSVDSLISRAANGKIGFGGGDPAADLVVLNSWHPRHARWEVVVNYLKAPGLPEGSKHGCLVTLSRGFDRVPERYRSEILEAAESLADSPIERERVLSPFPDERDAWGAGALLAQRAGSAESSTDRRLTKLLGLGGPYRELALIVAGEVGRALDLGMAVALVYDGDPRVRQAAAEQVSYAVARREGAVLAEQAMRSAARDPGTLVPLRVANALHRAAAGAPDAIHAVLHELSHHISADVRRAALKALASAPAPTLSTNGEESDEALIA